MFLPVIVEQEQVIGGLPQYETWNVPNQPNTLNGILPWTQYIGFNQWGVVNQAVQLADVISGTAQGGRLDINLGTNDYQVSCVIEEFLFGGGGTIAFAICSRMQGDSSLTFYAWLIVGSGGIINIRFSKWVNGSVIDLMTPITITAVPANSTLSLRSVGNQHTCYFNGTPLAVVDDLTSPINTGQFVGLEGSATTGNRIRISDFSVITPPTYRRRRRDFAPFAPFGGHK